MTVGSVVNAIGILRHLASSDPQGVNAIARAVSLSPSTCFNILKTLVAEDFVEFDPAAKLYSLGAEPARLFSGETQLLAWRQWAIDALAGLAQEFSLTCGLWRVAGNRVVLTNVVEGSHATRIHLVTGQRLPAYIGAMGRCIAAAQGLDRDEVERRIGPLLWADPPGVEAYLADMARARVRGWAIDDGNYLRGLTTIASPVLTPRGDVRACMIATMFSGQHDMATLETIGERLSSLAQVAQDRLNGGTRKAA